MKKVLKTILSAAMVAAMATSLVACGGGQSTAKEETKAAEAAETTAAAEGETQAAAEAAPAEGGLNICIITTSGVDDGSFNQNCYEGITSFIAENADCTVTDIKKNTLDTAELLTTIEGVVGDYDVLVLPGFNFAAIGDIAIDNPDTKFLVVDSTITHADGTPIEEAPLPNVYTMTFSEQQGGFFAGVAAAMTTTTGKVAVVNGVAYPSNVNYQYGFMSGVNYANAHFGTSAECVEVASYAGTDVMGNNVGGNYVGSFADEAQGKVVAETLIGEGVDILFAAAGSSGNGVFTAAMEASGVMVIGCDVDQYDDCIKDGASIVLTSTIKGMDVNVNRQLNAIKDGTFAGEDAYLDASTDSAGYVAADGRNLLSDDAKAKLEEVYALVKDGTIVPAADATANEYLPDNFPGL